MCPSDRSAVERLFANNQLVKCYEYLCISRPQTIIINSNVTKIVFSAFIKTNEIMLCRQQEKVFICLDSSNSYILTWLLKDISF